MSTLKRVGRSAVIYGLQPILARIVSVVMLPVYTRVLTPSDYGVLQLLDTTVDVAGLLFTAGAINGVGRFYFKTEDAEARKALLSTAFIVQCLLAFAAALCIGALAQPIQRYILGGAGSPHQVVLAAANLATSVLMAVPLLRLQLLNRATSHSGIALAKLGLQLTLNIVLVAVFRFGVTGVLISTLVSNVVIGGGLAVSMLRETGVRIDPLARAELARFGRPVRVTALGSYLMNFGDRYFLSASWGTAVVGTYGLAYQFGFGFYQFFSAPIAKAWDPIRFQLANRSAEERNPAYLRVFELSSFYLLASFTAVAVGARPIVYLLTTPAFFSAEWLIPPIVGATVIQAWTENFNFQISVSERTSLYTKATWVSVGAMLVLYAVLIPVYGALGAAWSTVAGYSLRAALTYRFAQAVWPIPYRWGPIFRVVGLSLAAVAATPHLTSDTLLGAAATSTSIFTAYLIAVWFIAVSPTDRSRILAALRSRGGFASLVG